MKGPNVNVYKIQIAYYFREKSEIRAFGLISSLYEQLKNDFKTEPQSIPASEDTSLEVPRCIWNDINKSLMFSGIRLDFFINVPSQHNWEDLLREYNGKISQAFVGSDIVIDRVGLVVETTCDENFHDLLKQYVDIEKFNKAREANIAWLENIDSYNVWTNIIMNDSKHENKMILDVNTLPDCRLSEQDVTAKDALDHCADTLKGKMQNVF